MKYKKYLTMFLAGTLVVSVAPTNIFAETNGQQVAEQGSSQAEATEAETSETETSETETSETETSETETSETESEGKTSEAETTEDETAEDDTSEDETAEGEIAEGEIAEDDTAEGETAEGDTSEDETAEGEIAEGEIAEGETAEGDTSEDETSEDETSDADTVEGDSTEAENTDETENTEGSENIEETPNLEELPEELDSLETDLKKEELAEIETPSISTKDGGVTNQAYHLNNAEVSITIEVPEGTSVYYTTDGTDPTESDTKQLYESVFTVESSSAESETIIIKAVAAQEDLENEDTTIYSEVVIKEIKFIAEVDVEEPTITTYDSSGDAQESYSYNSEVTVEIDVPINTEVFFTTDGTDPMVSDTKQFYEGSFTVALPYTEYMTGGTTAIKAVTRTGIEGEDGEVIYVYSDVVEGEVAFRAVVMASNPKITAKQQKSGISLTTSSMLKAMSDIANDETVVLSIVHTNDASTRVLYTLDGTDPRVSETAIEYEEEFSVRASSLGSEMVVLKVTCEVPDGTGKTYTSIRTLNLSFLQAEIISPELSFTSLEEGETKYANTTEVTATITNYDENLEYVYTLDGTDPTVESNKYDSSVGIAGVKAPSSAGGKVVLKAAAVKDGYLSEITTTTIYFKAADTLELAEGSYIADFAINCDDEDMAWLSEYIDTKDVELEVDGDGKMSLTIRFVEKSILTTYPDGYYWLKAAKFTENGEEANLTFEEPDEMESYEYTSLDTYIIKTITVPFDSLSTDVSINFQDRNDEWVNFVFTLNSEPKLASERTVDNSVMGYSINASPQDLTYDGYRQTSNGIDIDLESQGYSATRPMVYYFTVDDTEEIDFNSKSTKLPVVHSLKVAGNYEQFDEDSSQTNMYTTSDDPHTLNVRVKGYVEGLGWTDEISIPMKFNAKAIRNKLYAENDSGFYLTATGAFSNGTTSITYTIPYDTVFRVDTVTDEEEISQYADLISEVNAEHRNRNMRVLDYTFETPEGERVKILDQTGEITTATIVIPEAEGFKVENVTLYKITENGTKAELIDLGAGSTELGYGAYVIKNEYPGGIYVLVAGENDDMPTMVNGYYLASAKLKDIDNKYIDNEYANIIDDSYSSGRSVLDIKTYSKYMYLPLADKNGEYVTEFYYYDYVNSKYVKASAEETYSVDGEKYVKLAKIPITTKKSYLNVYFKTSMGNTQYGTIEMDYSSAVSTEGIYTQAPKMTTAKGATSYVNDDKATVSLSTVSEDAKIYYTCTSGTIGMDPDTTKAEQIYTDPFELSTENTEGETFTIRAVAVKSGFVTSDIVEYTITFNQEGMAAETAEKPVIYAKYESGETAQDGIYTVTITSKTEGASIYYTTDRSEPSSQNGTLYTESFRVPALTDGSPTVIKAIAEGAGVNASEISQTEISFSSDWWDNIEKDTSYEIPIKMLNYINNSLLSMGNGALKGNATLSVDENGDKFLTIPFQRIDMGGYAGYLVDLWYFENEELATSAAWKDSLITGSYEYTVGGQIDNVTIPLFHSDEKVTVGIESSYEDMGRQRATLALDYSDVIEEVTGVEVEKENQVDIPTIDAVLNAAGDAIAVTISMPSASEVQDADIYYVVSGSEEATVEKTEENRYSNTFTITKEQAASMGGTAETVNVFAVATKTDYKDSIVNLKKLTFDTTSTGGGTVSDGDVDVTQDGKYWVDIELYKESDDELSMGNVAFENNPQALIVTKGGTPVIQIGSSPVRIDPYYSALQEFQFKNAQGVYQLATPLETEEIKTTYNGNSYTFDYLKKFQFALPSVTDEYIDVKVKVPYTIMDSAVGESAIPARLKIDWSSLTVGNASDELDVNTTVSESSSSITSSAVDITDSETGIRLVAPENVLLDGAILSSVILKEGSQFKLAQKALGEDTKKFTIFNILAKINDEETSPLDNVKLYIPIPEDFDQDRVALYRINDDGTKTLIHGNTANGGLIPLAKNIEPAYFEFETDKLGLFALVETDEVLNVPVVAEVMRDEELFDDITGHWAKPYIEKAVEMGIFTGISDESFGPDVKMTRGMFVTVLGKMEGIKPNTYRGNKFSDVKDGDYYSSYVLWAADTGIARGIGDGTFAPNVSITREQMAVMFTKYAEYKGVNFGNSGSDDFVDGEVISDWAKNSVKTLAKAGVLSGRGNRSFVPKDAASRAEVAALIVRFMEEYMSSQVEEESEMDVL